MVLNHCLVAEQKKTYFWIVQNRAQERLSLCGFVGKSRKALTECLFWRRFDLTEEDVAPQNGHDYR